MHTYDVHIKNGEVIDGTGAPKFKSDIVIDNGKIIGVQSRNRNLNNNQDMLGFYEFVNERKDFFKYIDYILRKTFQIKKKDILRFTGEWVGPGVQSRVGLSDIKDRLWILFDISIYESDESNTTNNDIIEDPFEKIQL